MKRSVLFVDYDMEECNSVAEIQFKVLELLIEKGYYPIIAKVNGLYNENIIINRGTAYEIIRTTNERIRQVLVSENVSLFGKMRCVFHRIRMRCGYGIRKLLGERLCDFVYQSNLTYHRWILKKKKPDIVIYLTYLPRSEYADDCKRLKIKYIQILYDTFITRPNIDYRKTLREESLIIRNSAAYFVPSFFMEDYQKVYCKFDFFFKIKKYNLPLLIESNSVIRAFQSAEHRNRYNFSYFGQIQPFRNASEIKKVFVEMDQKLDIFTSTKYTSDDTFIFHEGIANEVLWETVASSKFLVAFDNSRPYQNYLPSKVYLYVSFTRPIIVFGDNENSALRTFLKDYPLFYYQRIGFPLDGLLKFIKKDWPPVFDSKLYGQYREYLSDKALTPLADLLD